jgi:excisionase family DNA binding protein
MARKTLTSRLTLTVEQAAEALGIGRTLAYEAVRRGEIPTVRVGRRLLVPRQALEDFLSLSQELATNPRSNDHEDQ